MDHPVLVVTEADPDDEEPLVELEEDTDRMVPDSSSVEDLVDTLDVADDGLREGVTSDENEYPSWLDSTCTVFAVTNVVEANDTVIV